MDLSEKEQKHRDTQRQLSLLKAKIAYTVDEFVAATGIGRSKLYEERKAGKLRFRKCGKISLITHDDGLAYVNSLPAA